MTLHELIARQGDLKKQASALLDTLETEARFGAADDDNAKYDALLAEIEQLGADIEKANKIAEHRKSLNAVSSAAGTGFRTNEPDPTTTNGFKSLAEFAVAVREASTGGTVDGRLLSSTPTNVHQGGGGSGEGYLLPTDYRDQIFRAVTEVDTFLSRFSPQPTTARSAEFVRDETTPWGANGVQANWRAESQQMTASKIVTQASRMEVHDLFAFAAVTEEMLSDAPRVQTLITQNAAQAIAWKAGEAVMWGDGVGKPLGFMYADALVTVAKEASQVADTIVPANVNKMYSRRFMGAGQSPFWVANSDIFPQLQAMGFGTDTPLFLPPNGIVGAPNGALLGYPIVYTEHASTLGDLGDLVLVDPTGYLAFQRSGGAQFAESIHLWFDYNMRAFRWTFRFGGQPILSAPISPARGSATKSHFIALAARA